MEAPGARRQASIIKLLLPLRTTVELPNPKKAVILLNFTTHAIISGKNLADMRKTDARARFERDVVHDRFSPTFEHRGV